MPRDSFPLRAFLGRLVMGGEGIAIVLVAFVLLSVAWPLERGGWVEGMPSLSGVVIAALGVGFFMSKSPIPRAPAHLLALAVGVGVTIWQSSSLLPGLGWSGRVSELWAALGGWLHAAGAGDTREGTIEFTVLMLLLVWALGYSSAWFVLHKSRAWGAVLPSGLILLVTLNNLPEPYYIYLLLYLLASLLLVVHLNMLRHQREWADRLVSFPRLVGLSHLGHLFGLGVIVLFLAWNVPQVRLAPLSGMLDRPGSPWGRIQDQFGRLFASLPSQKPAPVLEWGESHPFAGPLLLGDRMLFTVDSKKGHYWRARVYDVYTPQGWVNSLLVEQPLAAGTSRDEGGLLLRARVAHTVRTNSFAENLFTAGEPLKASMSTIVVRQQSPPGDLIMMRPQRELRLAQRYSVISLVSAATSSQLQEAGSSYPEAISDRYLRLPPDLPQRIRRLSRTITQGLSTPYDKAIAIQRYLRAIPYDTNIPAPPPGADGVDYFLFSRKAGYCDYYASAMSVMLRSVGVPSRFVLGYQPGDWDDRAGVYAVREYHYHSWPEAYFPGYGWVEFEPTPSQAERVYAPPSNGEMDEALEDEEEGGMVDDDMALGPPALLSRRVLLFWGGGMALLLAAMVSALAWYRRWWKLSRLDFPANVYAKMSRLAYLARIGPQPHDTPSEYAHRLSAELPSQAEAISLIADAYVRTQYSPSKFLSVRERRPIHSAWARLRRTLLARILRLRR